MPVFNDATIERIFGIEDAENENHERLKQYFFRNKAYEALTQELPIRILVGHKGVGKSALLKMAAIEDDGRRVLNVWIKPNDLVRYMGHTESDINRMIEVWKRAITDLIFEKTIERIGITKQEEGNAIAYSSLKALISGIRAVIVAKYGEIVDTGAKTIASAFLKDEIIRVYIDDLDRGWKARPQDIESISALLNAIRDLCGSDKKLQIRMALRTDVYYLVRTSDESTDKIERNIIWLTWDNHEILALVAKRIASYFGNKISDQQLLSMRQSDMSKEYLSKVITERFNGLGKWENAPIYRILTSLVRRRPRDMVKLFYGGARAAFKNEHEIISTTDLRSNFEHYSNERLQDIQNEFATELPKISALLQGMKPTTRERQSSESYLYTNDQLTKKLQNIMQNHSFVFANGKPIDPKSLAEFLYKIDFLIARKDNEEGKTIRYYFDQNRFLQNQFGDFGFKWEVHPAYRWALQPGSADSIFKQLDLNSGD